MTASIIVAYLINWDSVEEILEAYPSLTREDVQAALVFAAEMTEERVIPVEVAGKS